MTGQEAFASPDPLAVSAVVQAMYDALAAGDRAGSAAQFTDDACLFDLGARFDADGLLNLIQDRQRAGYVYAWKVTDADVHFAGDTAWIAYVNRGGITKDGETTPMVWLESAVLTSQGGRWRIRLFHSTRAASPTPPYAMALTPDP